MDPSEIIRHAKGEFHAWYTANEICSQTQQPECVTSHMLAKHMFSGWCLNLYNTI